MIEIDATSLSSSFNAFDPNQVAFNPGTGTPFSYTWDISSSSTGDFITAFGSLGDFNATTLTGTVHSISIATASFNPLLSIAGLESPLTDLIDSGSTQANFEKFWNTVLAGETTIFAPQTGSALEIFGDVTRVQIAEVVNGATDHFIGTDTDNVRGTYVGDAAIINLGGTLNGGNDVFTNISGRIVGDAYDLQNSAQLVGVLNGGHDTISTIDAELTDSGSRLTAGTIYGDAIGVGENGTVRGGNDTVTLRNLSSASTVYLDVDDVEGIINGGDDTLLVETTVKGKNFTGMSSVFGDGGAISTNTQNTAVTGGNDTITGRNVSASSIYGDFSSVNGRDANGGHDTILFESTFAPDPLNSFQFESSVSTVYGDTSGFNGSSGAVRIFRGGNDTITLRNVSSTSIYGDVASHSGDTSRFYGGNDTIWVSYDFDFRSASYDIYGDASSVSALVADFGDDAITYDVRGSEGSATTLFGDTSSYSTTLSTANLAFGNDTITVLAHQDYAVTVYGDLTSYTGPSINQIVWGNDVITTGAGDDRLYGDIDSTATAPTATSVTGGNDILDGGLGDDILDGGFGINTASFASVAQAVSVMLAGIPGTGSTPADLKHAVGQGSDTLINIHNVTGSSRQDTIIGDSNDNVLSGRGSRDLINGDGGNDTIEGGRGDDNLDGSNGADSIFGGSGNDVMNGGSGPDMLFGGLGDDIMDAGVGRDTLKGGSGRDIMTGGGGPDTFVFCDVSDSPTTAADRITDFVAGADRIDFDDLVIGTLTFETGNAHTGGGTASVYLSVTGSGNTNVFADADGDGSSDMRIILLGSTGLGATDFIL